MATAQFGIFAIGTSAQCHLEFRKRDGVADTDFVRAIADVDEPHSTVGGVNIVSGVRPSIWATVAQEQLPPGATDFAAAMVGPDGFTMPATQRDGWLWVSGAAPDLVFDVAAAIIDVLRPVAELALEVTGWSYRHTRDLTGFEDGTENPPLDEAGDVATVAAGRPGAGSSIVLLQKWVHDTATWSALPETAQEKVIGRTKPASIELDGDTQPPDSHVSRTVITDEDGKELHIFRRNVPYGTVSDHGTHFVGFSCDQTRLHRMLEQMAGIGDGVRDALTRYTTPLSGSYYVVPSIEALRALATPIDDD